MHNDEELFAWLLLSLTKQISSISILKLIERFHSPVNILSQDVDSLATVLNKTQAQAIYAKLAIKDVESVFNWLQKNQNNQILTLSDSCYPVDLAVIDNPPIVLYLTGRADILTKEKIAIVGTRNPTLNGKKNAEEFSYYFNSNGFTVVSGMARGIDRSAHLGALKSKNPASTIGVLGCGIDIRYPSSNNDLYEEMSSNGLLISEFPLKTPPFAFNFPKRNKILVALAKTVLVVEAKITGGAMLSANLALNLGKEVCAIPGGLSNMVATGCNHLIKFGAKLVDNPQEMLEDIFSFKKKSIKNNQSSIEVKKDFLLELFNHDKIDINTICEASQLSLDETCIKLLELELQGKIINCGGGYYKHA